MISFISRSVGIAVAAALGAAPAIATAREVVHQGLKLPDSATLPKFVEQEAIASVEAETGEIAGIRIGNSAYFIAYIKAATNCGSGGCRAQIWKRDGDQYVRQQSLPVGYLPITMLPDIDHGGIVIAAGIAAPDHSRVIAGCRSPSLCVDRPSSQ